MSVTLYALQHIAKSPDCLVGRLIVDSSLALSEIHWHCGIQAGVIKLENRTDCNLKFGCLDIQGLMPGSTHEIEFSLPLLPSWQHRVTWRTLPKSLPRDAEKPFNLLLTSCYYQEKDHTESNLGRMLPEWRKREGSMPYGRPDAIFCMGDQIYADVPLLTTYNNQNLLSKYRRNFLGSPNIQGLNTLLTHAATAYLPDDHEYWNNYPDPALWSPRTYAGDWQAAAAKDARSNLLAFQTTQSLTTTLKTVSFSRHFDIGELAILFLDTRSHRSDKGYAKLLGAQDEIELNTWQQHCLNHPEKFPVIVTGQLLTYSPAGKVAGYLTDYELANFKDFSALIVPIINKLSRLGSILMLTGDVHWSRYRRFVSKSHPHQLHEIVVSPSSLVSSPGNALNWFKSLIPWSNESGWNDGDRKTWRSHPHPELDKKKEQQALLPDKAWAISEKSEEGQRGDQVAMLSLHRTPEGVVGKLRFIEAARPFRTKGPIEIKLTRA